MDPTDVVVLSDDRIMADLILLNLQQRGYRAHWMPEATLRRDANGEAFLRNARVVIVDVNGPDAHVWQTARVVRQLPDVTNSPLLLLLVAWPNQRRLDELEPCAWLRKPCSMVTLVTEVERRLREVHPAEQPASSARQHGWNEDGATLRNGQARSTG